MFCKEFLLLEYQTAPSLTEITRYIISTTGADKDYIADLRLVAENLEDISVTKVINNILLLNIDVFFNI